MDYIITKEDKKRLKAITRFTLKYAYCQILSMVFGGSSIFFIYHIIIGNINNVLDFRLDSVFEYILFIAPFIVLFIVFFMPLYIFWNEIKKNKIAVYRGSDIKLGKSMEVVNRTMTINIDMEKSESIIITDLKGKKQKLQNFKHISNMLVGINTKEELEIVYLKRSKIVLKISVITK